MTGRSSFNRFPRLNPISYGVVDTVLILISIIYSESIRFICMGITTVNRKDFELREKIKITLIDGILPEIW